MGVEPMSDLGISKQRLDDRLNVVKKSITQTAVRGFVIGCGFSKLFLGKRKKPMLRHLILARTRARTSSPGILATSPAW